MTSTDAPGGVSATSASVGGDASVATTSRSPVSVATARATPRSRLVVDTELRRSSATPSFWLYVSTPTDIRFAEAVQGGAFVLEAGVLSGRGDYDLRGPGVAGRLTPGTSRDVASAPAAALRGDRVNSSASAVMNVGPLVRRSDVHLGSVHADCTPDNRIAGEVATSFLRVEFVATAH